MVLPFSKNVFSEIETAEVAKDFSKLLINGSIVLLNGDLGAGKTFFVKSICKEFGINNVTSPTFAIVNEYNGYKKIYHFDFYRIRKTKELLDIGFNDYLSDEAVVLIEWADMYPEILPHSYFEVNIKDLSENKRNITINFNE